MPRPSGSDCWPQADAEGLPHQSLADLSAALPNRGRDARRAGRRGPPAGSHSSGTSASTQWVAVQRTVLHLSQMLEIIATGGRTQPTYGKGRSRRARRRADRPGGLGRRAVEAIEGRVLALGAPSLRCASRLASTLVLVARLAMSLFGSIQMAGNTLQAMQIGLHVVGNNIANANTPGYIRERAIFTPAPVQKLGNLTLGLGVEVAGIVQNIDKFVEDRLRGVGGDRASAEIQEKVYLDLEADPRRAVATPTSARRSPISSTASTKSSISPRTMSIRNLAVQAGKTLTTTINNAAPPRRRRCTQTSAARWRICRARNQLAHRADSQAQRADRRRWKAAQLVANQAGGLRSQRHAGRQTPGRDRRRQGHRERRPAPSTSRWTARCWCSRERAARSKSITRTERRPADGDDRVRRQRQPAQVAGGELHGVYEARDEIVGGFLDRLDELPRRWPSSSTRSTRKGRASRASSRSPARTRSTSPTAALDAAGLDFTPDQRHVQRCSSTTRRPELTDDAHDSRRSQRPRRRHVAGVAGRRARRDRRRAARRSPPTTAARSPPRARELQIAFDGDTSGVLAALGINTFFTGSTAGDLGDQRRAAGRRVEVRRLATTASAST